MNDLRDALEKRLGDVFYVSDVKELGNVFHVVSFPAVADCEEDREFLLKSRPEECRVIRVERERRQKVVIYCGDFSYELCDVSVADKYVGILECLMLNLFLMRSWENGN